MVINQLIPRGCYNRTWSRAHFTPALAIKKHKVSSKQQNLTEFSIQCTKKKKKTPIFDHENCHQPAIHLTVVPVFLTSSHLTEFQTRTARGISPICQGHLVKRPMMSQCQSFGPWRPESVVSSTVRSASGCLPP